MDLQLTESQALLRESIRALVESEVDFRRVRELESAGQWDERLWTKLASLGWLGLPVAEELGGGGGTLIDTAIVLEELTRRAASLPYAEVMASALTLARDDSLRGLVEACVGGTAIVVPAVLDEGDSFESMSREELVAGAVNGNRPFVDYGQFATAYLVRVRRDGDDALELAEAGQAGVSAEPSHTTGRTPAAVVRFDHASSSPVSGRAGHARLLLLGRALASIQCVANASQALDMSVDYVKNRVQFGRPIGSFQAVQHHIANMALLVEAARFLAYEAVGSLDAGPGDADQVAVAKAFASRAAVEVTALAHQLHGGIGVTEEYDLHFFSLRAKERAIAWGTADECVGLLAQRAEAPVDWFNGTTLPVPA